jgi:hypothetical protein
MAGLQSESWGRIHAYRLRAFGELVSPKTSHQVCKNVLAWQSAGPHQDRPRPPNHPQTDPSHPKTKIVVVTGIKKNPKFGRRPTLRKKTAGLQSRKSKNWSLTVQKSLIEKKLDENFSHENFPVRRSGTLFGKFDFGGLPFSNHVSP